MDDKSPIVIKTTPGTEELVIRQGEAEVLPNFRDKVKVCGVINTPLVYLKNPPLWFKKPQEEGGGNSPIEYSSLIVARDDRTIVLKVDEGTEWESEYKGIIKLSKEMEVIFHINNPCQTWTPFELAKVIKMNRSYFDTKVVAMKIESELKNFSAKVNKTIEESQDGRGNRSSLRAQAVESNLPETFKLTIPVFKRGEKATFEVEVEIQPSDLSCTLVSPDIAQYIQEETDKMIDEQLTEIRELHPCLKIFEK